MNKLLLIGWKDNTALSANLTIIDRLEYNATDGRFMTFYFKDGNKLVLTTKEKSIFFHNSPEEPESHLEKLCLHRIICNLGEFKREYRLEEINNIDFRVPDGMFFVFLFKDGHKVTFPTAHTTIHFE